MITCKRLSLLRPKEFKSNSFLHAECYGSYAKVLCFFVLIDLDSLRYVILRMNAKEIHYNF